MITNVFDVSVSFRKAHERRLEEDLDERVRESIKEDSTLDYIMDIDPGAKILVAGSVQRSDEQGEVVEHGFMIMSTHFTTPGKILENA